MTLTRRDSLFKYDGQSRYHVVLTDKKGESYLSGNGLNIYYDGKCARIGGNCDTVGTWERITDIRFS